MGKVRRGRETIGVAKLSLLKAFTRYFYMFQASGMRGVCDACKLARGGVDSGVTVSLPHRYRDVLKRKRVATATQPYRQGVPTYSLSLM